MSTTAHHLLMLAGLWAWISISLYKPIPVVHGFLGLGLLVYMSIHW